MLVDDEDEGAADEVLDVDEGVEAEAEEGDEDGGSLAVSTAVSLGVACSKAGELGLDVFDAVGDGAASLEPPGVSASAGAMACTDDAGDAFTSGVEGDGEGGGGAGGALLALEGASCGVEAGGTLEEAGSACYSIRNNELQSRC